MKRAILLIAFFQAYISIAQPLYTDMKGSFTSFKFRTVGPSRGGRVTAVTGVPSQRGTFYMGATGGGVWMTNDYGTTWTNISDGYFATPSIGDINVAPSNNNIIYVGTGTDGLRSNIIVGKGVYRSTDAGKTWKHAGLTNVGQIGAVEINPSDPNTVFVAAIGQPFQRNPERGVYRTTDGGETWDLVLHHSDTVGAVDLEFVPNNPNTIYAALWRAERKPWTIISGAYQAGGIYKSTDNGNTWRKLMKGLPGGLIGKIDLAVSAADPNIVYALIEAPPGEGGLYVSNDQGESFSYVPNANFRDLLDRPFYYCNIEASPQDAQSIYAMAEDFMKSTDGGRTWKKLSAPHGDHHDMWINPNDTLEFIESNDGGTNITVNGGRTWSTQNNQPTAELYQVHVDDQYPYWLYAGQQDNTSIAVPSLPPYDDVAGGVGHWMAVGGCETGPSIPKPGDPNIVYSSCKGRFGVYNKQTGQEKQFYVGAADMYGHNPRDLQYRFQRVSPVLVSPHNPNVVYHASQYVHKTVDEGRTWLTISPDLTAFDPSTQVISGSPITRDITGEEYYSTIYSIAESLLKEGLIWVGANDGPVHVTTNGGREWKNVTPPGLGEGGRVNCVEPSPHELKKAYVTILRYQLGDWKPYLFRTDNLGKSWELLTTGSNGIPADHPVRVVREDPVRQGLLYAGTEYGLFISFDDGANWIPFQQNLPITPVTDIKIYRNDLVLSTMGRSFWILDNVSTLREIQPEIIGSTLLFKMPETYSYRYKAFDKGFPPQYPAPAATIDYILASSSIYPVIEIYNKKNQLVRSFHCLADSTNKNRAEHSQPLLENSGGLHRLRWDLKHYGAWDPQKDKRFKSGPRVAPGVYTVKLIVGNESRVQKLTVLSDPRVRDVSPEDLYKQESVCLQIRDLLDSAKRLANQIQDKLGQSQQDNEQKILKALHEELVTREGAYMTPMLIDQIAYLASMLDRADQPPGKDALERLDFLKSRFRRVMAQVAQTSLAVAPQTGDD